MAKTFLWTALSFTVVALSLQPVSAHAAQNDPFSDIVSDLHQGLNETQKGMEQLRDSADQMLERRDQDRRNDDWWDRDRRDRDGDDRWDRDRRDRDDDRWDRDRRDRDDDRWDRDRRDRDDDRWDRDRRDRDDDRWDRDRRDRDDDLNSLINH